MIAGMLFEYFRSLADALPWWVLLLGASVGHGYLLIIALNIFYARPLPHELMKYTRKLDLLIALGGPPFFALALDLLDTQKLPWQTGHWRAYLSGYTVICWIVGSLIAPLCEIFYLMRRQAPQLVQQTA